MILDTDNFCWMGKMVLPSLCLFHHSGGVDFVGQYEKNLKFCTSLAPPEWTKSPLKISRSPHSSCNVIFCMHNFCCTQKLVSLVNSIMLYGLRQYEQSLPTLWDLEGVE